MEKSIFITNNLLGKEESEIFYKIKGERVR